MIEALNDCAKEPSPGDAPLGRTPCVHCGTKFQPSEQDESFCCSGCEYVHRLIHDESLERFYELRGSVSRPVGSSVFGKSDFAWLGPLGESAEAEGARASLMLGLDGVSCVGCVWLIDHLFAEQKGGISCRVNVQYGTVELEWQAGRFDLLVFARRLKEFGYQVCPATERRDSESKKVVWRLGLAAAFALNGMLYTLPTYLGMEASFAFAPHFNWLSSLFATLSLLVGGSYFIGRAIKAAWQGIAHLDMPISIGIVCAYLVSWYGLYKGDEGLVYFDFVSTFVFLMLTGRWVQVMAVERNRNRLAGIALQAPQIEIESAAGGRVSCSADQLKAGDRYWLGSGQRVPARSILRSQSAGLGMDWISGETESKLVAEGSEAPSGASLENRFPVELEAREDWEDSLLAKLTRRSPRSLERDRTAQKWIFRYLLTAAAVALAGGLAWALLHSVAAGLMVFISVLVVSCPCALGIAWPFADEIALLQLQRRGVFVTTHSLWNRLSQVRQVIFDKTGTLTRSSSTLLNAEALGKLSLRQLQVLSTLCAESRHPVSTVLREQLMAKGLFESLDGVAVSETVGRGLSCQSDGQTWRLGRSAWAGKGELASQSETLFTRGGELVCSLRFDDQPLPDSRREVEALRHLGLSLAILSGDLPSKAKRVGQMLGLCESNVFGGLLPEEKAAWLGANGGDQSLMVGDGANDTLAFKKALCCGAPANEQGIVAERADFHYLGNGIQGIRSVLKMARQRRNGIAALMVFAIGYNVGAVGVALAGAMTPLLAAILMPLSSIASLAIVWSTVGRRAE